MPVVLPFAVAVLLATLLRPVAAALEAHGVRPALAAILAILLALTVFGALIALILPPFIARLTDLGSSLQEGVQKVAYSAGESLAGMDRAEVDRQLETAADRLRERAGGMAGDALAGVSSLARRARQRRARRLPVLLPGQGRAPPVDLARRARARSRAARRSTRAAAGPGRR